MYPTLGMSIHISRISAEEATLKDYRKKSWTFEQEEGLRSTSDDVPGWEEPPALGCRERTFRSKARSKDEGLTTLTAPPLDALVEWRLFKYINNQMYGVIKVDSPRRSDRRKDSYLC